MFLRCPQPGESFGAYQVESVLGRGGQGVVLRAQGPAGPAALKLLLDPEPNATARFRREARVLSKLDHPGLVRVLDAGAVGGVPFLATELLSGETLRARVQRAGPLPQEEAVACVQAVAEAVEHCHARGVIHRDLKPENVLWVEGRPVVIDFGLARRDPATRSAQSLEESVVELTATGEILGTPSYMAPEQVDAGFGTVGEAADVYALGGLLHFLLSGRAPFDGASAYNVLLKVMREEPPELTTLRPDVDAALSDLCRRTLAKDPTLRPASAAALGAELSARSGRRRSRRALAGLALAVVGVLAGGAGLQQRWRASEAAAVRARPPSSASAELLERGAYPEAADALAREAAAWPRSPRVLEAYLDALEGARDWEPVPAVADALLALEPDHPRARRQRAFARYHQGAVSAALAELNDALARHPSAAGFSLRGSLLHRRKRSAEALADSRRAIAAFAAGQDARFVDEAGLHLACGNLLVAAKEFAEGERELRRAMALDPERLELRTYLARALTRLKRFEEADAALAAWAKRRPDAFTPPCERARVWLRAAQFVEGRRAEARARQAIEHASRAEGLAGSNRGRRRTAVMLMAHGHYWIYVTRKRRLDLAGRTAALLYMHTRMMIPPPLSDGARRYLEHRLEQTVLRLEKDQR